MAFVAFEAGVSLDGLVESPHERHFPYFNDEMGGRPSAKAPRSYGESADYWPNQGADVPFASFLNSVTKFVVSLPEADAWRAPGRDGRQ